MKIILGGQEMKVSVRTRKEEDGTYSWLNVDEWIPTRATTRIGAYSQGVRFLTRMNIIENRWKNGPRTSVLSVD